MAEISLQAALDFLNQVVYEITGRYLVDLEVNIFIESWQGLTYKQMGTKYGYSPEYLNNDVGYRLWEKLSEALGEEVGKKNFKHVIQRKIAELNPLSRPPVNTFATDDFQFPEGSEPPNSPFYIERDNIEKLCKQTIIRPGALVRIKAPRLTGKTSLLSRIIDFAASSYNYQTVRLEFDGADRKILQNINQLLRWICFTICRQLDIENHLKEDKYWNPELLGNNANCTVYFENYLIPTINAPFVLVLDDVDRVFPYPEVIEDFFGMLRSWHEKGKISKLWQQVRLVMAHSTEVYIPLDLNQSPFNAGVPVELKDFNLQQVLDLAHLHRLKWNQPEGEQLMNLVGGHPYLVRMALYQIGSGNMTLERCLTEASTEAGIYSALLRRYLQTLKGDRELAEVYKQVVASAEPVALDSTQIFRLHSLGLTHYRNNHVMPRCNLYRQYFTRVL